MSTAFGNSDFNFSQSKKTRPTIEQFLGEKFYISIETSNFSTGKRVCEAMTIVLNNSYKKKEVLCAFNQDKQNIDYKELQIRHTLLVRVVDDMPNDTYKVIASDLLDEEYGINQITWNLKDSNYKDFNKAVKEIIFKLIDYEKNVKEFNKMLFFKGIAESDEIIPIDEDFFTDSDSKTTMSKEDAFKKFTSENKQNKNYIRAAIELGTLLGIGKALYLANHDKMKEDQEYNNNSFSDFKNRMFTLDQSGFDDNDISMNWGHTYAGMLYYQSARNNGFTSKESFLVTLASSTIWEVVAEASEILSLNDQINTSIGGTIIGEVAYQISNMLKTKSSTTAKIISAILNPLGSFDNWLSGKKISTGHRNFTREYGFNDKNYDDFNILIGLTYLDNKKSAQTKNIVDVGFNAEVINLPVQGFGKLKSVVYDPLMASMSVNMHISKEGIEDFHTITKLVLAGYFNKNITSTQNGSLRGYSYYIGASARAEYRSRGIDHFDDFFATVNVLGGTLDVHYFIRGTKVRFAVDLYGDFAMVRPHALKDLTNRNSKLKGGMTVLRKDYYYATGATRGLLFSVEKNKWKTQLEVIKHHFQSISNPSLDRYSENITRKLDIRDKYSSINFWVSYQITDSARLILGLEKIIREGIVYDQTEKTKYEMDSEEERLYLKYEQKLE